ncbi:MAG: DUF3592 domain-containing protein [Burkholderiaceae bacterium]|nr:DUF3592 domain-containing protein [Burkholderiaceae bacterium]
MSRRRSRSSSSDAGRAARPLPAWQRGLAALVVTLLGLSALWTASGLARTLWQAQATRHWQPVSAQLLHWQSLGLGRGTVMPRAGAVPMQQVVARYRYEVDGRSHEADGVALTPLRDNFSDRHRDRIIATLRAAEADGGRLQVWVDPAQPQQALVDRRLPLAACGFQALLLLFPGGLATLVAVSWGGRLAGRPALALPLWALLHGLTALPILALAAAEDLQGGPLLLLAALVLLGALGAITLLARLRRPAA